MDSENWPYSRHHCPCSRHHFPYSGHYCPYSRHRFFFYCPCPGHQKLMFGIRTEKTGLILDIKFWYPRYGQVKLAMFRTSTFDVRNMASCYSPYSGHQFPQKTDVRNKDSDVQNMDIDVRNMDSDVENMENIWNRDKIPVLIPDLKSCYPGYGQWNLALFWSRIDLRNKDGFLRP